MSMPSEALTRRALRAAPAPAADEWRATAAVTAIRRRARWHARLSSDLIHLTRSEGRVAASDRQVPRPAAAPDGTAQATRRHLAAFDAALSGDGVDGEDSVVPLESALIVAEERGGGPPPGHGPDTAAVRRRISMLVRVESPAGPLLLGAAGPDAGTVCAAQLLQVQADFAGSAAAGRPAAGWRDRPLLLAPPVAAAVVSGVAMALGSPGAARLDGCRVLPDLTLVDEAPEVTAGRADDAGRPAEPLTLLHRGRVAVPPRDPGTGLVLGRARWDHDSARLVGESPSGLRLTGGPAPGAATGRLELLRCVEGLRRYHLDGRLRVVCLARVPGEAGWFRVELTARPLTLLRAVTGVCLPAVATCAGDRVHTPALLLPAAAALADRERGEIDVRSV
ncbi:hypothetical protein [Streptomyces litchfieldiae]|uniref:Uncharacterized protein n=1 Tax=Streptomyces litchfieldiae TaxID=3075543 RepID=A0ABU2MPQ5_9ACTN|nr:hypothetical protein [Streptomyces sp. DSM 44938]MDT0343607.1 hypothetical protein [Streptomyces sp. DSM 44938]